MTLPVHIVTIPFAPLLPGVLSTAGGFNYELVREYVLNVEAKDQGEPPLSDMCMVSVYITDANDNAPTFSQATYSANVGEDAKIGVHVIQVSLWGLSGTFSIIQI